MTRRGCLAILSLVLLSSENGQAFSVGGSNFRTTLPAASQQLVLIGSSLFCRNHRHNSALRATVAPPGNDTSVTDGEGEGQSKSPPRSSSSTRNKGKQRGGYSGVNSNDFSGKKFRDTYQLNEALNRLAEQASDSRQSVVRKAMLAEELWKEFQSPTDDDNNSRRVNSDVVSFNTVLKAWCKASQVLAEHHYDKNHDHLLDPDIPIYTARECCAHAVELLEMQEKYAEEALADQNTDRKSVVSPDVHSFNTCMDAWAKSHTPEAIPQVEGLLRKLQKSKTLEPDVISYNALVDAYAFSDRDDRLDKLRQVWDHMTSTPHLQPTSRTTNSMLHGYSLMIKENPSRLNPEIPEDATLLAREAMDKFDKLKKQFDDEGRSEDQPDVMTYTTAMDVWAKVGTLEGAQNAEALFRELKARGDDGTSNNMRPNSYSYTTLITAWARISNNVDEASDHVTELLEEMMADKSLTSMNHRPFTAALRCWSRGRVKNKAVKALDTLKKMKQLAKNDPYVRPNVQTYHAALECCAKITDTDPSQQTMALKIAFAILQSSAKDGIAPSHLTYSKVLRCVEALLPPGNERNQVAKAAFEKALADGVVEATVITSFKKAADVQVVLETAIREISDKNGFVDLSRIPQSWKRNVK